MEKKKQGTKEYYIDDHVTCFQVFLLKGKVNNQSDNQYHHSQADCNHDFFLK